MRSPSLDPTARRGDPVRPGLVLGAVLLVVAGCSPATPPEPPAPSPGPSLATADPRPAAAALADGLTRRDLRDLQFAAGREPQEVNAALQELVRGMGPRRDRVSVASVQTSGDSGTAVLNHEWSFPGVSRRWTYQTTAALVREAGAWTPEWAPALVEPGLTGSTRLSMRRLDPARGELLGASGTPIVTARPVVRIGLDKAELAPARWRRSARRLARLVKINPDRYARAVAKSGPDAFVEAIVLRATAEERPANSAVARIPGALAIDADQMLGPTRNFARALLGTVGPATREAVQASSGTVVAGDQVGLSGLQRRYDAAMRGTPGVTVRRVPTSRNRDSRSGASGSPTGTPPAPPSTPAPTSREMAFEVKPVSGRNLATTLNVSSQRLAERTLRTTKPAAALVAIRPSTGAVIAAANNAGAGGQALATTGRFAPGSTFKVATALALLRSGLTPRDPMACPSTITVDGRTFGNYSDYPRSALGKIDLQTALAQSCNTAFIGQRGRLGPGALAAAAASLGLGRDYDVGFPSFFGSVPRAPSGTAAAAAVIGQGTVEASPLAMAAVAASVTARRTVVPHLIEAARPSSRATPLAADEARRLHAMMAAVVEDGSAHALAALPGPAVIAKSGTAEYGTDSPLRTHAWMVAAQGDLAVAVFVADGRSGSRTAGPLVARFLRGSQ